MKSIRWPNKIRIKVRMDSMGNILARPVTAEYAKAFESVVRENGGPRGLDVFFQEGDPAAQFLEDCSKSQRDDIEQGWNTFMLVDPLVVGHWYGYDAHTAVESGKVVRNASNG